MVEPGAQFGGRYQLLREIGSGGMGRVYQAVDTQTGRSVAAKVMLAGNEDDLEAVVRFYQEAAVLSRLKHPSIVEVYGGFLEDQASCIIMEFLEGWTLGHVLRRERPSLERAKVLIRQVASALAYAHSKGVIHRDIKPDNIMVVGHDRVKVTDFGIARVLPTGVTQASGGSIGTPLYMSPEQIEGARIGGKSDIYSLGAVLYHMMTGRPPFEGEDPLAIAFQHLNRAPEPPTRWNSRLPADWEGLILRMLAKDPLDRYESAAALERAIAGLSTDELPEVARLDVAMPEAPVAGDRIGLSQFTPPGEIRARAGRSQIIGAPGSELAVAQLARLPERDRGMRRRFPLLPLVAGAGGVAVLALAGAVLVFRPSASHSQPGPVSTRAPAVKLLAVWDKTAGGGRLFNRPQDVEIDQGGTEVFVASYGDDRIDVLSPAGKLVAAAGASGRGAGQFRQPTGVAVDGSGNIYVADSANNRIQKLALEHTTGTHGRVSLVPIASWGKYGSAVGEFKGPHDVALDSRGDVLVTDYYNNRIQKLSPAGAVLAHWGTQGSRLGQLDGATDLAVDRHDNVYVSDFSNDRIQEFSPEGRLLAHWDGHKIGFAQPHGVAVDRSGNLYVAEYANDRIVEFSPAGRVLARWGKAGSGPGQLDRPSSVAVDAQGRVYVADTRNDRVQVFSIR